EQDLDELFRRTGAVPDRVYQHRGRVGRDYYSASQDKGATGTMAATVSWDALRDLAGFRASEGVAVSFYLDLDPGVTPTAGDLATRVNSLLAEAGRHADRSDLNHEQRKSLRADIERIRSYFENDLVRDGAHGLAVFADDLDNLWRPLTLTESVTDAV